MIFDWTKQIELDILVKQRVNFLTNMIEQTESFLERLRKFRADYQEGRPVYAADIERAGMEATKSLTMLREPRSEWKV